MTLDDFFLCEICKRDKKLCEVAPQTAYANSSLNVTLWLCEECAEEYTEHWNEMWREYRSGLL